MTLNTKETKNQQEGDITKFLPEEKKEELEEILAYWEKMKKEWEEKKKEFRENCDKEDFMKLLEYRLKHQEEIEKKYEYLDKMKWVERDKFIEEYLHDDILYSGKLDKERIKNKGYSYQDWQQWKVVIEEWVYLDLRNQIWDEWAKEIAKKIKMKEWMVLVLSDNLIWDEWAKALSQVELKEWVVLSLRNNQIWAEWAKAIAENMNLKNCVTLDLYKNQIWAEWAKAIAENMHLKNWVTLDLFENQIWDIWAEAISKMELKKWVVLDLRQNEIWNAWAGAISQMELKKGTKIYLIWNPISNEMKEKLRRWAQSYIDRWINCELILD